MGIQMSPSGKMIKDDLERTGNRISRDLERTGNRISRDLQHLFRRVPLAGITRTRIKPFSNNSGILIKSKRLREGTASREDIEKERFWNKRPDDTALKNPPETKNDGDK
jgi:hypothetical protein